MKATLAALAVSLLVFSSGCRGLSCTESLSSMAGFSSHGGGGCSSGSCSVGGGRGAFAGGGYMDGGYVDGGLADGGCSDCGGSGCGGGGGLIRGGGGLIRGGLMGCGGGGMCTGRCGGLGGCGGQLTGQLQAQLDQFKAMTARNCANGGCGLPPGPQTGAVQYPYYTTRGPRDFFMCNPPSIGP